VKPVKLGEQILFGLVPLRIRHDAIHRANELALWIVIDAHAFRTFFLVYDIFWKVFFYGVVLTRQHASVTDCTAFSNHQGHGAVSLILSRI
jgi:hypothetical protein